MIAAKPHNIDEYIALFSDDTQKLLKEVRSAVKKAAPAAEETISYGMPTFTLKGKYLVYFSAYKKHIGFYPVPTDNPAFEKDFSGYKTSGKGAIQFPLDKPMPLGLITKLVKFRIKENEARAKKKK